MVSRLLVDFFLIAYQLGICCVYIVFVGVNIKAVGDQHTSEPLRLEYYILAAFIPFVLINCVRNLKLLAPFSTLANIITFASFGVVCYYVFQTCRILMTDQPLEDYIRIHSFLEPHCSL